jgi:predicted metal-binding protein
MTRPVVKNTCEHFKKGLTQAHLHLSGSVLLCEACEAHFKKAYRYACIKELKRIYGKAFNEKRFKFKKTYERCEPTVPFIFRDGHWVPRRRLQKGKQ